MRGEWIIFNNIPRSATGFKIMPGFYAKRVLLSVVCVLIAALFSSCGLPTSEYLSPPVFKYADNVFILQHNYDNYSAVTELRGYEIYYRLFENLVDAKSALKDILRLGASYSPDQFMLSVCRNDAPYPFFRMLKSSGTRIDSSYPLLPAPNPASEFTYTIDMTTWQVMLPDNSVVTLLRNNNKSTVDDSTFNKANNYNSNAQSPDQDYSGSSQPKSVYLVLFAVAYGTSASSFTEVYSSPIIIPSSIDDFNIQINFF